MQQEGRDPMNPRPEVTDPLGMSPLSLRRRSVQIFGLLCLANVIVAVLTAMAVMAGDPTLIGLSASALGVMVLMTALAMWSGVRTVAVELWIRRLGVGDFEFRIEPRGNDEVSKICMALDTLRQSSIRAMQVDVVQGLSEELREKNGELEQALVDLRQSQDRIISQQKLAELGELSAGVAHEMRNPLQFIQNFTSSSKEIATELVEILEEPEKVDWEDVKDLVGDLSSNMERVLHHSGRANGIVSAMLTLDRGVGGAFRPVDLNGLLVEQTHLAHRAAQSYEAGFGAEIIMELEPGLEEIVAVPEDIARVIANVVTNACQSMAERERLEEDGYKPEIVVGTASREEGVEIVVRDNGMGMTPEIIEKMFNPFFTTRDTGRNTGLGLSLSYDVVREHGGEIYAESEPKQYAEIRVVLPRHPGTQEMGGGAASMGEPVEDEALG